MSEGTSEDVLIALGSNLGDRRGHFSAALAILRTLPGIQVTATSRIYETPAFGGPSGQNDYLNAVARLRVTGLDPQTLLEKLLEIEMRSGRVRVEKNGPRTLDLDILLWGRRIIRTAGLTVPHAAMPDRPFVLVPAADVAAGDLHPVLDITVGSLLRRCRLEENYRVVEEANWHHGVTHSASH